MNELGDFATSSEGKESLVNTNTRGDGVNDVRNFGHRFDRHKDDEQDDSKDGYSLKSDVDSVKFKEVDRFGFVGGSQYTDPLARDSALPLEILRLRESKWLDMLENWDKWMSKKFRKVKERCRKGIPDSLRARVWQRVTGSATSLAANPGRYQGYLQTPGNPACLDEIKKDVSRQYPHHELFMDDHGQGQEDLYSVLMAYSVHDPTVGYCQAQGPLAAVLLTVMPAEQAFWCFLTVCEKYLPGYYNAGLEAVQIDSMVLFGLLKKVCPTAYKHLKKQKVEPILWMTDWFMCLYSRTLPWPSVLRVWDMFLCEGVKVMFQVALVLVKSILGTSEQVNKCPTFYETLDKLRKIPVECMEENYLVRELSRLQITERDMEKEHQSQLKKWNAMKAQKSQKNNSSQAGRAMTTTLASASAVAPTTSTSSPVLTPTSEASAPAATTSTAPSKEDAATPEAADGEVNNFNDRTVVANSLQQSSEKPLSLLPTPGSLLLPASLSTSKSLLTVTSNQPPSISVPSNQILPGVLMTVSSTQSSISVEQSTINDLVKFQKPKKFSKGSHFSLRSRSGEKKMPGNKPQSLEKEPSEDKRGQASEDGSQMGVEVGLVGNHEVRRQSKPSISPCSSLSTLPSHPERKKRTFRLSWHKSKGSKSTTHIDQ